MKLGSARPLCIARAIDFMQTEEKKRKFREIAFADSKMAYNPHFKVSAVEKVTEVKTGKFFKSTTNLPIDDTIERFQRSMAFSAIEAHEVLPTTEEFEEIS